MALIDVDDDLLAQAMAELGTTTNKDTVNEALRLAARRSARAALANYFGADITDPEIMNQARR